MVEKILKYTFYAVDEIIMFKNDSDPYPYHQLYIMNLV